MAIAVPLAESRPASGSQRRYDNFCQAASALRRTMSPSHPDRAVSPPAPALRPFIARYAGACANGLPPGTHAGLPSRHVDLIISLGRPIEIIRLPGAAHSPAQSAAAFTAPVGGLKDAPVIVRRDGNLHLLHLFLTPLGVRAILGVSSLELASRVVDFSDLWGCAAGNLIERLRAAVTWQQRFAILDEEFLRALTPIAMPREIAWAWGTLAQAHGCVSIPALARHIGWSRRHFSERFRTEIGLTPKTAARIFRFERACWLMKAQRPGLAEAASACGYHDQAHMTLEWNALAGCTPRSWILSELPFLQDYELAASDDGRPRSIR
jgi:AraC-like DNA-binding protein